MRLGRLTSASAPGNGQEARPAQARIAYRGPVLAAGVTVTATAMAIVGIAAGSGRHDVAFFTREPATAVDRAGGCDALECAYAGAQANVSMLIWWSAAVVTLCCAAWAYRTGSPWASFLLAGGLLTALLTLDDVFQGHENVAPELLPASESKIYVAYGLVGLAFVWAFRRVLPRTDAAVLLAAAIFLVVSAGVDHVAEGAHLLEDGAKLLGIVLWSIYFVGTSAAIVGAQRLGEAATEPVDAGTTQRGTGAAT